MSIYNVMIEITELVDKVEDQFEDFEYAESYHVDKLQGHVKFDSDSTCVSEIHRYTREVYSEKSNSIQIAEDEEMTLLLLEWRL